jgi:hypothetical protein
MKWAVAMGKACRHRVAGLGHMQGHRLKAHVHLSSSMGRMAIIPC